MGQLLTTDKDGIGCRTPSRTAPPAGAPIKGQQTLDLSNMHEWATSKLLVVSLAPCPENRGGGKEKPMDNNGVSI